MLLVHGFPVSGLYHCVPLIACITANVVLPMPAEVGPASPDGDIVLVETEEPRVVIMEDLLPGKRLSSLALLPPPEENEPEPEQEQEQQVIFISTARTQDGDLAEQVGSIEQADKEVQENAIFPILPIPGLAVTAPIKSDFEEGDANFNLLGVDLSIDGWRAPDTTSVTCDFSDVRFSAEFPQGRFGRCERGEDGRVIVHLEPESTPINPSPWHAFTVEADEPRTIEIEMRSEYANTRYSPKMSYDRDTWKVMDYVHEGRSQFFTVEVGSEKIWIAGQELFDNNDYQIWLAQLEEMHPHLERIELGRSAEDRELPALVHRGAGNEWLLILGRQHPPEITGAMATRTFVETLLNNAEFSEHFLARYNILVAPNLNPDGVAAGHWRHNANGVDLNRDWFRLEQPETQAVHAYIEQILEEGGELVYGVDFHSTFRDVYYTIPGNYLNKEPDFSFDWLNMLAAAVAPNPVQERASANPSQGNFKQYMADTHGTHAVTYEVADNTDRLTIGLIATHAGSTLMDYMLQRPLPLLDAESEITEIDGPLFNVPLGEVPTSEIEDAPELSPVGPVFKPWRSPLINISTD